MNFENALSFYSEESTLQEQLDLFHHNLHKDKHMTLDQLLSTPLPTMYTSFQPVSPSSSHSSYSSGNNSPILTAPEHFPTIKTTPPPPQSTCRKKVRTQKSLPPGQSTLPIRVMNQHTKKRIRSPRHLECFNCKATKTPLWRRTPDRTQTLCNACGLYYKQYEHHRPLHVRHKPSTTVYNEPQPMIEPTVISATQSFVECINCQQTNTPLWRKNEHGSPLCNACGLYFKLHHRNRPVEMRKSTIQRRRRDWACGEEDQEEEHNWIHVDPSSTIFLHDQSQPKEKKIQLMESRYDLLQNALFD